jgi:predicted PurR-regulated permease PerM
VAFGSLFGFVGLLLAVPVSASIGVLLRYAMSRYMQSEFYTGEPPLDEETAAGNGTTGP